MGLGDAPSELGVVVAGPEGPSAFTFTFLAKREVKIGEFVEVVTSQGVAYGTITEISKTNRYFESPEMVRGFDSGSALNSAFPVKHWECVLARVKYLGVDVEGGLDRVLCPPSPGAKVFEVKGEKLSTLLGFTRDGLEIGRLRNHKLSVKLDIERLLQKHLSILAMSGAGKSNCARVVVEELLSLPEESGRPAVLIIDAHGEYSYLKNCFPRQVRIVDGSGVRIGLSRLTVESLREFIPEITGGQVRELKRILASLKSGSRSGISLEDLSQAVESSQVLTKTARQALSGWIFELQALGVFDRFDFPRWNELMAPGVAVVLDLGKVSGLRRKQVLVAHLLRKIFYSRWRKQIPPTIVVLEEAHNFAPSESAISKHAVEQIAREGRKFYLSLIVISQRPVRLSTTLLSQMGSTIVLRMTNPYDLEHLKRSSESITSEVAEIISSLPVGEALVLGEAVNFPIFVRIRKSRGGGVERGGMKLAAMEFERSLAMLTRTGVGFDGSPEVVNSDPPVKGASQSQQVPISEQFTPPPRAKG